MGFRGVIKDWGNDLLNVLFPNVCGVCGTTLMKGERVMCLTCRANLPRTNLHNVAFSEIHQRLATHSRLERGASYFYYYKGSDYAKLIHKAKYNGLPRVARQLAADYAREIAPDGFFDGIDIILPVPLHYTKRIKRGYNQTEAIARGVSDVTGIPIAYNLVSRKKHSSQTRLGAYSRWLNARDAYDVEHAHQLDGKHLLIVDDVLTTGATLLACCESIHSRCSGATLSVLTLGLTRNT